MELKRVRMPEYESDSWSIFDCEDTQKLALSLCKGGYQEDLIRGYSSYSGSDLKGNARTWKGSYTGSRDNLIKRLVQAGLNVDLVVGKRGKLYLRIR